MIKRTRKKHSQESIEKQRQTLKLKYATGKCVIWNKGKTKETDKRVKVYTKKVTETARKQFKEGRVGNRKGVKLSKETIEKMKVSLKGRVSPRKGVKLSEETKLLIGKASRLAVIQRKMLNNGVSFPNYNKKACEFFKCFDEKNCTKGRYAVYGNGEYHIKDLGYWTDYINFDLKLIMEYDESHHYDTNDSLREQDIQRQEEIQELFPDFKFERIKEF